MRRLEQHAQFKKDFKREARGNNSAILSEILPILLSLATDQPLAAKHSDHQLTGDLSKFRDCHIRPDLVLLYRKLGDDVLQLVRLGSHSELGL